MSALKTLTGTAFLAAPTVTLGVTGEKYIENGMNSTEDIRLQLEYDVSKSEERNIESRNIEKSVEEIRTTSNVSQNMIVNEINALKVSVWENLKTDNKNKESNLIEKNEVYEDKLAKDVATNIQAYRILRGEGYGSFI